jgi:hypothetical protein
MHAGELWWVLYEHKHLFAKKKKSSIYEDLNNIYSFLQMK